jgi:hypothetical protein
MDDGMGGDFTIVHNALTLELILSQLEPSRFYRLKYAARNILFDSNNMFECDKLQYSGVLTVLTAVKPTAPRSL